MVCCLMSSNIKAEMAASNMGNEPQFDTNVNNSRKAMSARTFIVLT